jgi:hypothetical protein
LSHGASLLAWSDSGVTAFSSTVFGAPARNSDGLQQEVESILNGLTCDRSQAEAATADLKTLGAAALPVIAAKIPHLTEPALAVAADVLADAGYRPAAASLAARLHVPNSLSECAVDWGMNTKGPTVAILRSLARIGGAAEVAAVASILEDAGRDEETRLQAFATLASLGTPSALRIVRTLLTRPNAHASWYEPPSPKDFATPVGRGGSGAPVRIRLSDIEKDSDGDGLPDLVERRLRTNPNRRDTDGDGVSDGEDPTPRGSRLPRNEHDRIVLAILDQFFLFDRSTPAPVVIVHDVPLAWDQWRGATLTLTAKQVRQLEAGAGYEGILRVRIVPGLPEQYADMAAHFRPLRPDERRYTLEMVSGGLSGVGYEVVVGRMAGAWVVKECRPIWLS